MYNLGPILVHFFLVGQLFTSKKYCKIAFYSNKKHQSPDLTPVIGTLYILIFFIPSTFSTSSYFYLYHSTYSTYQHCINSYFQNIYFYTDFRII